MGTLDASNSLNVNRRIKLVEVTGYTPSQIEAAYNQLYGKQGWQFKQVVTIVSKIYIILEQVYA